jgi:hypothetical protein
MEWGHEGPVNISLLLVATDTQFVEIRFLLLLLLLYLNFSQ